MAKIDKKFVNEVLYRRLLYVIPDSIEAGEVANALQDDVMQDIAETADPDNWHSGDIDIAFGRVLKKRLLSENDEPQKVWVLFDESLYDYELQGRRIMVFKSEDEARKKFKEFANESRKTAEDKGWEIGNDNDDFFEAYPEGSWGTSHETVELSETTFSESIWCHN